MKNSLKHLSKSSEITKLTPRVPSKVLSRENAFEDNTIKRISFSSSIDGCILGLQLSSEEFTDGKLELFVYKPIDLDESKLISNREIVKEKLVFDAKITNECWYLSEVDVELFGSITVYDKVEKVIEYKPIRVGDPKFLKSNGKLDTYLLKWEWTKCLT